MSGYLSAPGREKQQLRRHTMEGSEAQVPLGEFVRSRGIRWQPVGMRTWVDEDGQPRKQFLQSGLPWAPKTSDFQASGRVYKGGTCQIDGVDDAELARRQAQGPSDFIALDTWVVPQIDVDDSSALDEPLLQQLKESAPYFLSTSKNMPHFFVSLAQEERRLFGQKTDATVFGIKPPPPGKGKETAKVEVLWGIWSFARKDAVVYNAHLSPPLLRAEQLLMSKKRKATQTEAEAREGVSRSAEDGQAEEEPSQLLPPEANLSVLLGLLGFPVEAYAPLVQQPVPAKDFRKYGTVAKFKARAKPGYTCHMCGDVHTDNIQGTVTVSHRRACAYQLTANHFRLKSNPDCKKVHTISAEAAAAHHRRVEAWPNVGAAELAALRTACQRAGAHLNLSRACKLADPAPGFEAYAIKQPDGRWRALLLRAGAPGLWHRFTAYPGLYYEYLEEAAWESLGQPGPKPPFWG